MALSFPSFSLSPTPCSALQVAAESQVDSRRADRSFQTLANGPTTVFIPTYGSVTLPSNVDPSLIPGYNASTSSVSNQFAQQAIQYLSQFGLIDLSSSGSANITTPETSTGAGSNGGASISNSTVVSSSSSSTGVGGSGNSTTQGGGNGNGGGTRNGAGAKSSLSWTVGTAVVALGLSAVAASAGLV